MPHQHAHDARGLVQLAIANAQRRKAELHPGVQGHLRAAYTQLDAVCTLLDGHRTYVTARLGGGDWETLPLDEFQRRVAQISKENERRRA